MTDDKWKVEAARLRGVVDTQRKEIERLSYELQQYHAQQQQAADELRRSLKRFLLQGLE